jgi:chromosome segregation ATPase
MHAAPGSTTCAHCAATAVGLIALLDTSGDEAQRASGQAAGRIEGLARDDRRLERRLEQLGERIDGLPQAEDLDTLEGRLGTAEDDAGEAASTASDTADRIDALEQRIEDLEAEATAPDDAAARDAAPPDAN